MKRKLLLAVVTFLMTLSCAIGLTACGFFGHKHQMRHVDAVDATCTEDGNSEYWACSTCSKYFSDADGNVEIYDVVIPASHLWEENWTIDITPTDQNDGEKSHHCSRCDERKDVTFMPNTSGFLFRLNEDGKSYACVGLQDNNKETDLVIPEIYSNLPVTKIDSGAFSNRTIFCVTFPDTVKEIGDWAFSDSTVFSITFSENSELETIGYQAFFRCSFLKSVILPKNLSVIGSDAFAYAGDIVFYSFSEQKTGENAPEWHQGDYWHFSTVVEIYWGCDPEHLIVQNGLEYVIEGTHAKLTRCNTRETTVFVPTKITFNNQDYLITEIGDIAFVGYDEFGTNNPLIVYCENERNDTPWLDIPYTAYYGVTEDSFIMLEDMHFVLTDQGVVLTRYVGTDSSVSVPKTVSINGNVYQVKIIGDESFKCSKVKEVTLPEGITKIGSMAFWEWRSDYLEKINLPDSVTKIEDFAFYGTAYCSNMDNWTNDVLYIGNHLIDAKTSLIGEYAIKTGTLTIADSAFEGCSGLTSISIPDSVTNIGDSAFKDCTVMQSVTIPDSVINIGDSMFEKCSSLTNVFIPDSVTNIGNSAFSSCNSLTTIRYTGTMEQWTTITKGVGWNFNTGSYTIVCSNGNISKN